MLPFIPMIASAIASISAVVATIAPAVASFCTTVLPKIGTGIEMLKSISNIISGLANIFGIFKDGEQVDEMGDRAMQAAEKGTKPANFDKYDEYVEAIRNFPLDPVKSEKYSDLEKSISGMAIAVCGMEDKFKLSQGALTLLPVLAAISPAYFTAVRLASILDVTKDIGTVIEYFEGSLSKVDRNTVENVLVRAEQAIDPDKTPDEIRVDLSKVAESLKKTATTE